MYWNIDALMLRAKRLLIHAERLDLSESVRMQRNSENEEISLVCAAPTAKRDQVLLVFKTIFNGRTEFFTGILYLSKTAAAAAGLIGAWYREVYGNAKTYWIDAEWGSWPIDEIQKTAKSYGLADDAITKLGLTAG